jgi:hypothetical protein
MKRILPVDDEAIIATQLQELLISIGYDVPDIAVSGVESIGLAKRLKPFDENQMKSAIELALHKNEVDKLLKQANQMLEQRVQQRTAELTESNFKLFEEIQEHKKTEAALVFQTRRIAVFPEIDIPSF